MMKLNYLMFLCFALATTQASAEQAVVIDMQMLGEQSGVAPAGGGSKAAQQEDPLAAQAEANKERILKGGKMSARQKAAMAKDTLAESNAKEGEEFLNENKAKQGVVTLPSGVQYSILKAGKGKKPKDSSTVMCRFKGTLIDGTVFDHTDEKIPSKLLVSEFIPGLSQAIKLMPARSKWQIVVPPNMGHGAKGNRGIGPNAVLIYEFELISVR